MAARLGVDVLPQASHPPPLYDGDSNPAPPGVHGQPDPGYYGRSRRYAHPATLFQRRIHDSTTIGLPDALTTSYRGCGNHGPVGTAGMKCAVQLNLLTGALCGIDLVDGRAADHALPIQHAPMPAGSLRLADLGFYNLTVLQTLADAGSYWLSRIQTNSRSRLPGQPKQSILEVVTALGTADHWESPVIIGTNCPDLSTLLIQRVPEAVAAQRRQRVEEDAHGKRRPVAKKCACIM